MQQARLLSLRLTGHIRDLACSLVITIRPGDITAISCQPVKTARWFPWPNGLCEERRFIKYPIGQVCMSSKGLHHDYYLLASVLEPGVSFTGNREIS